MATVVKIKRLSEDSSWNFDLVAFDSVWFISSTVNLKHLYILGDAFKICTCLLTIICQKLEAKSYTLPGCNCRLGVVLPEIESLINYNQIPILGSFNHICMWWRNKLMYQFRCFSKWKPIRIWGKFSVILKTSTFPNWQK